MSIEIKHSRREGTLIEGTSRNDGSKEVLRTRHYSSGYTTLAKWSRNLGCWYLPYSRDKRTSKPMLEALAERLRTAGFEVTVTVDETDRRSFAEAEADRVERAEDRADRFGQYADNATTRSEAAWKRSHEISERFHMGQPILVGHHSERRARRDHERMDSAMRTSIGERDKAGYWADREKAAAGYEAFRKNPGRTLRRIEKLNADLRAVEKWQRGDSACGYTRDIGNPDTRQELEIRHQELTEEIAYWQDVIKEAEKKGFKVWGPADFEKGDFVNCGSTWYQVQRVNKKTLTIPHIHGGIGVPVLRRDPADKTRAGYTVPYDTVKGWASAEDIARLEATEPEPEAERTVCPHCARVANGQKRFSQARGMCTVCGHAKPKNFKAAPAPTPAAAEHQERAEQAPPVEVLAPAAETFPMCHSDQWHAVARRWANCHHTPAEKPTPAPAPAVAEDWQEDMALVLIASKNSRRTRKRALWAMTRREAQAVCGDPRTSGRSYMLTWTDRPGAEGADWEWVPDNGSLAPVLSDLDITPRREWPTAPMAPAAA
ncbi:DUF3560 domain-containing protein [Streptomyces sp. NPDC094438]|uniref:DUF3560 domain-containing protein n=1 Tax=Streptomyces sp. NPDC094438 TaxID=3366061 RepID=UPI00381D662F